MIDMLKQDPGCLGRWWRRSGKSGSALSGAASGDDEIAVAGSKTRVVVFGSEGFSDLGDVRIRAQRDARHDMSREKSAMDVEELNFGSGEATISEWFWMLSLTLRWRDRHVFTAAAICNRLSAATCLTSAVHEKQSHLAAEAERKQYIVWSAWHRSWYDGRVPVDRGLESY